MKSSLILPSDSDLAAASLDEKRELFALLARKEFLEDKLANRDLGAFSRAAWEVLEPATSFKWNWHLDLLCEYLQLVRIGKIRRLIFNVPPQTTKSRLGTVFFPAWWWSDDPSRRFMACSYSGGSLGLATQHSLERRSVLDSEWYKTTFGNFNWTKFTQQQYDNDAGGRMFATSTGATATGKGFHVLILDDLLNPKKAESDTERQAALKFVDQTLRSRLSDQVTGAIVIIEQRLHENDVTGHVLKLEPGVWTHISIPMEAEKDEEWVFPISGRVHRRKEGEGLWDERFPESVRISLKRGMGTRAWGAQYQQRPSPAEGVIFNPTHWRFFVRDGKHAHDDVKTAPMFEDGCISVDCAFKEAKDTDNVAIHGYGFSGIRNYLWRRDTKRRGYTATKLAIREMKERMNKAGIPCNYCLIEDKANGPAIIEEFSRDDDLGMTIIAVEPLGGKVARAWAAQPEQEVGHCYLAEDDKDTPLVVGDFAKFPAVDLDDDVDAFTQLVNWRRSRMSGLFELWKEEFDKREGIAKKAGTETAEESKLSLADAQKRALDDDEKFGDMDKAGKSSMSKPLAVPQTPKCPKCGNINLTRTVGAVKCNGCGWSKKIKSA